MTVAAASDPLTPAFDAEGDPSLAPVPTRLSYRKAYYHLVNVEEHPEVLPLAYDVVVKRLNHAKTNQRQSATPASLGEVPAGLTELLNGLTQLSVTFAHPWRTAPGDLRRRQVLHYFVQYMPTAFVDGSWLQCGLRVATAHTKPGALLTGLYQHQVRAFVADPGRHFVADYRAVYDRLGAPIEEVSSRSFSERPDFREAGFALPIFLLGIAQF